MLRRAAQLGFRALGIVACLAAAGALIMYLLALQALRDLAGTPGFKQHASGAAGISVAAMHDGSAKVVMDDGRAMELGGHMTPIKAAEIVGGGAHLMTADATGHIRFTALDAAHGLRAAGLSGLSTQFYDAIWRPYGMPVARWSLDWVAQVLPLHIPDSRKGARGRVFRDCDVCPEMVEIEPGMFFMGSPLTEWERSSDEGPRHLVTIPQRFAVGRFEVTFDEWDACVKEGGCENAYLLRLSKDVRSPVVGLTWTDAQEYVAWLNKKVAPSSSLTPPVVASRRYRLLTEAEWEFAARAGSTAPFGLDDPLIIRKAPVSDNASGRSTNMSAVGTFSSNPFGIYDMLGNAREWVDDCYIGSYDVKSPEGLPALENKRCNNVIRGGSSSDVAAGLRHGRRSTAAEVEAKEAESGSKILGGLSTAVGFRVAKTLAP